MLKRTLHSLFYMLTGVLVAVVFAGALTAWRLGQGPVSLAWAVPTLEYLVNRASPQLRFEIGDLIVSWAGWAEGLDARLLDVRVLAPDQRRVARVPELSVALSAAALKAFRLAPTEIRLYHPRLRLIRREDGALEVALADGERSATPFRDIVQTALRTSQDPENPLSYLQTVTIVDGRFVYRDRRLGASWRGRLLRAQLVRGSDSLSLEAKLGVAAGQEIAAASLNGVFAGSTGAMAAQVQFQDFRPAAFAAVSPALGPLQGVDLPLDGTASIATSGDGGLRQLDFDVRGGEGRLVLTEAIASQVGLDASAAQELGVREVGLSGRYDAEADLVELRPSGVAFVDGAAVRLPAPLDQTIPLASIAGHGTYAIGHHALTAASLDLDLAGPKLSVTGQASGLDDDVSGQAVIDLGRVKVDQLSTYWPKIVAPGGRAWALEHLSAGSVDQGEIRLAFAQTDRGLDLTELDGRFRAQGVRIDYLPPAPPLREVSASATLDLDTLTVEVARGEAAGLTLTAATAALRDLRAEVPRLELNAGINGTVPLVLGFLAREPFGYTKDIGIDAGATRGDVVANLSLALPLVEEVKAADVRLRATADVSELFVPKAFLGGDVTGGSLHLSVDETEMDVVGPATFENIGVRLAWHENFNAVTAKKPYVRRIELTVPTLRLIHLRRIEPMAVNTLESWIGGPLAAQATVTFKSERDIVFDADIDASGAAITFPPLGWSKERGKRTFVFVAGRVQGDRLRAIDRASISAPALEANGAAGFSGEGKLERITIGRLISGKTDASALAVTTPRGGWNVVVRGAGLDLHPLMQKSNGAASGTSSGGTSIDDFTLSADLDRVWLEPRTPIRTVNASVTRERGVFSRVQAKGVVGDGAPITVDIGPINGAQARLLRVRAENAGAALRALNIYPDVSEGELKVNGRFDDTAASAGTLTGDFQIKRFRLLRAPILAQILNVMALTGIIDLLRGGQGITFTALDAPFSLRDDVLSLNEAKMHGTSLGLTASGTYDLGKDAVDIRGTIVPFYIVNSLLGRLPLIGGLFSGGERGGGLFAALYSVSGTIDEPTISVNPVSALAPGVTRNLFELFNASPRQDVEPVAPRPSVRGSSP